MTEAPTTTLRTLLLGQQRMLETALGVTQSVIGHPTAKGDAHELDWLGVLEQFLPERYSVTTGFVIDSNGRISKQQDLIIYDRQFCPLFFRSGTVRFVPAESVYAVLEVKQRLNADYIEYAAERVASVRELYRTNLPVQTVHGRVGPQGLFDILGGIIALRSDWNPPLGESFEQAVRSQTGKHRRLDIGCSLQDGGFNVAHSEGAPATIHRSDPDASLMFFLQTLYTRLQSMANVRVMDLAAYGRSLSQT